MCSAPRQQKPVPVAGKVAAATHTIDAASAKIGMPGSTSWKRDRNAPRNKLQPLSLPLQALSSTVLKEEVRPLAKRNQLSLPGSASLASTSTASADWRGTAGRAQVYRVLSSAAASAGSGRGIVQPTTVSHTPLAPHSRKDAWGGGGRGQAGHIPLCWVLPAGRRNFPWEAHQKEGDGEAVPNPILTLAAILSTPIPSPLCCQLRQGLSGHCNTLGISSAPY